MNERIKELAKQSGFYFYDLHNIDGQDYGETIEADNWNAAEKFAELIVQECIGIIEDISPAYNDYRDAIEEAFRIYCVAKIKQDFGIKNERTN